MSLETADHREQALGLDRGQHGRGLVEDDDAMRHQERAGDLHKLPVGDREATDRGVGRNPAPEFREGCRRAGAHRLVIDETGAFHLAAQKQILRGREIVGEQDFLVHEDDAALLRLDWARENDRFAVEKETPFRGRQMPSQDPHQRRLAGPVLADHGMDLAGVEVERHVAQNLDGSE